MGRVYGVQGRAWAKPSGGHIDQLKKIVDDLTNGIDDRRRDPQAFITRVSSTWVVYVRVCTTTTFLCLVTLCT